MILIISSVFPPEPVVSANIARDLAVRLSEQYPVTVLTPKPTRPQGFRHPAAGGDVKAYRHIILNSYTYPASRLFGRLRESWSFGRHAAAYIRANHEKLTCVVVHSWPLTGQFLILRAIRKFGLRAVTHVVDIYPEALMGKIPLFDKFANVLLLPIDRVALQQSSLVVTISPKMQEYLSATRKLPPTKTAVVYNWQNEGLFLEYRNTAKPKPDSRPFTFMFLGNLGRTAALHVLIKAFAEARLSGARLVIAGSGSQKEELVALAGTYPESEIAFRDAPMHEVPAIQDQADVLLLGLAKGAATFALPSKLPAYMFSGKPILATVEDDSGTASIIREASCGWVVSPEETEQISNAMKHAFQTDPSTLVKMGEQGFAFAMGNFSKQVNLEKFAALIESVNRQ